VGSKSFTSPVNDRLRVKQVRDHVFVAGTSPEWLGKEVKECNESVEHGIFKSRTHVIA
jgi:hypothetical protein